MPALTCRRERLSRRAADHAARPHRLAGDAGRRARASAKPRHRRRSARRRCGALPLGLQQLVEVARVLYSGARIIILDEPTSALAPPEVERLFILLRRLRDAGRSIVFISHFLDDVLTICDRVTVFRNGQAVATEACSRVNKRWIIDRMIGAGHEELEESYLADI